QPGEVRDRAQLLVEAQRREERAIEPELWVGGGRLDRARRGVVVVLRQERRGEGAERVAVAIGDGGDRGVAVAEQEDRRRTEVERVVDRELLLLLGCAGRLGGRHDRLEAPWSPELRTTGLGLELDLELVDAQRE